MYPHSVFCPKTNSALGFLESSLGGVGTIPTSSWWDRLKISPKLQTPVRWGKTAWNTTKAAAPFALPAVDWGLHVYSEYQDGYDIHDALGRGNVRFVTDNVVYGGIYGGIGLYAGFWPTLAIGGLSFAAEFVPEYSHLEISRGHNSMAQAVQNQDPMAFWDALQTTRHMHGNNAFKDIFTAPRVCATWAFDQVQTHAPEITKTISLMSRYNRACDLNTANAEHLRALQRVNWLRGLFGKEPYDTSHLHVENPRQLMARVEMEQAIEDTCHAIRRGSQEMEHLLKDYQDGCDLRTLPRIQLFREQQEALDDMFDIYGGL